VHRVYCERRLNLAYAISQIGRKRIEEVFGWMKTVRRPAQAPSPRRRPTGDCAKFTREAIEAGFVNQCVLFPRPHAVGGKRLAMDYGPSLVAVGIVPLGECAVVSSG
jgi:hypothetical protein